MLLLLARHGNTFDTGDKVVWVGARTDLALTEKGRRQAADLAAGLAPIKERIERIVAGPLKRTRDHAAIVAEKLALQKPVEIDERLREIDYGQWEGKSSEEIQVLGGESELNAWNEQGAWPLSPGWFPTEDTIAQNISRLALELSAKVGSEKAVLLVTSNGILKFFLKLVPGAFEEMAASDALKVATGHCCALHGDQQRWRVAFWNRQPTEPLFE
jgi:probable phosphoglycerate mutase